MEGEHTRYHTTYRGTRMPPILGDRFPGLTAEDRLRFQQDQEKFPYYPITPGDTVMPPDKFKGRLPMGKLPFTDQTLAGIIRRDGKLRIDCVEIPEFWMEVDLSEVLETYHKWKYHPDNEVAQAAIARASCAAKEEEKS